MGKIWNNIVLVLLAGILNESVEFSGIFEKGEPRYPGASLWSCSLRPREWMEERRVEVDEVGRG